MRKIIVGLALVAVASVASAQTPWACSLDNVGATLTLCKRAPTSSTTSKQLWVTDIVATSTTSTAGQFILRYGTGTNCGTGTASLFPSAASAVRFGYPANTSAPTVITLATPLVVPAGKDLCVLAVSTNTITVQIHGTIK